MRIFITGATGFIGTELVKELLEAGHQVRGFTRSDAGAEQLQAAGAEVHRGDLTDQDSPRSGAAGMDVAVNLAFNHDFSQFAQSGQDERKAIETWVPCWNRASRLQRASDENGLISFKSWFCRRPFLAIKALGTTSSFLSNKRDLLWELRPFAPHPLKEKRLPTLCQFLSACNFHSQSQFYCWPC